MIYFEGKTYATVWTVKAAEKYIDLQVTTSENKDGEYVNSSWFARCIGKAFTALKDVKRGDRILIKAGKMTNERFKKDDEWRSYFKFLILDAEVVQGGQHGKGSTPTAAADEKKKTPAAETPKESDEGSKGEDDDFPW